MSDVLNPGSRDDELEQILKQVRAEKTAGSEEIEPEKEWSMADIDRLIAEESGEKYVPTEPKKDSATDRLEKMLSSSKYDESIFTIKDEAQETAAPAAEEMTDIFSGSEVEGQEMFFDEDELIDDFDPDLFSLETIVMPDSVPEQTEIRYGGKPEAQEPLSSDFVIGKKNDNVEDISSTSGSHIDFRKKFFEKLKPEDIELPEEEEKEPEYPVDKSGIVVKKYGSREGGDLEAMPTVMAAEDAAVKKFEEEKTKIIPIPNKDNSLSEKAENNVDGQIILTDFVDIPQEAVPEQSREDDVEENLNQKRKQKAKSFKIEDIDTEFGEGFNDISEDLPLEDEVNLSDSDEAQDVSLVEEIGEYTEDSEKNKIYAKLRERVSRNLKSAVMMGAVEAILLFFALITPLADNFFESGFFSSKSVVLCVLNALMIIAAVILDSGRFFDTFTQTVKGKITGNSATVVAVVVALIENTLAAVTLDKGPHPVFGVIAVFGLLLNKITDVIDAKRILNNFSVCAFTYEHNMYAVHPFDNESEVFELGRGLLMGDAKIYYSSNIAFPSDFIKNSESERDTEKYSKYMLIGSLAASLIAGIIVGIVKKDFMSFFVAFTAGVCLSAPIFGKFIPSFITFISNSRLNRDGAMIAGIDTADTVSQANAVVLDSADIFDRGACTMHGMKDFKSMRIDVVLLYAAAMVIKSGGPLKDCFEQVVDGRQDLLPPVRELVYEDKMGISARIYEQKVLLGNRNMLVHHNIKAPEKAFEDKYAHDGRKIIYLACNEQLAAMFVVSYSVDDNIKNYLKQLENNGIQILVRTNDVNVTEDLISGRFGLNPDNFKILSSVAGRLYKRRKDAVTDRLPAGIIHDGEASSMLKAIAAACSMASKNKFGVIMQMAAMVIGILLTVIAGVGTHGVTTLIAVLIMLLESAGIAGTILLGKK